MDSNDTHEKLINHFMRIYTLLGKLANTETGDTTKEVKTNAVEIKQIMDEVLLMCPSAHKCPVVSTEKTPKLNKLDRIFNGNNTKD